jgi:Na+/H+-dicarboxylate symporter
MGVFFTSQNPVAPAIKQALKDALQQDPKTLTVLPETEASARAHQLAQTTTPQFNLRNFLLAVIIAAVLLGLAIWLDNDTHRDISKALMTSFTSFSGIVLGLLGGEAQKSAS